MDNIPEAFLDWVAVKPTPNCSECLESGETICTDDWFWPGDLNEAGDYSV